METLAAEHGLLPEEVTRYGRSYGKIDAEAVLRRLGEGQPRAKYIDVTAMTPTPLGEGKTTTTMGLTEGLGRLGQRVIATIRQPSGGPTFNIKGGAAGGGLAQCLPLAPLSLGLTGDIDAITNANNLCMTALTARMQHERNYDDAQLAKRALKRLDIDPARVQMRWAIDFCAQALRNIVIGRGGKMDGYEMDSGFYISVASEVMAILALSRDLADLRARMSRIVVAFSRSGELVTAKDLEVDGAMTAWMVRALQPTLMQTLEGQPVFVHAGPFANIAIGQSSVLADRLASRLADYVITESGFASDIGFEKFWNIKCRATGMRPDAAVVVATVRSLKLHGGGPAVKPGAKLDAAYTQENLPLTEAGCENLRAHLRIVRRAGIPAVVCLNAFHTDTQAEWDAVRRVATGKRAARGPSTWRRPSWKPRSARISSPFSTPMTSLRMCVSGASPGRSMAPTAFRTPPPHGRSSTPSSRMRHWRTARSVWPRRSTRFRTIRSSGDVLRAGRFPCRISSSTGAPASLFP